MQLFDRKCVVTTIVLCALIFSSISCTNGAQGNKSGPSYSFVYLGDMHFDKMAHHDFEWVKADKPNDIRQIEGYVKNERNLQGALV